MNSQVLNGTFAFFLSVSLLVTRSASLEQENNVLRDQNDRLRNSARNAIDLMKEERETLRDAHQQLMDHNAYLIKKLAIKKGVIEELQLKNTELKTQNEKMQQLQTKDVSQQKQYDSQLVFRENVISELQRENGLLREQLGNRENTQLQGVVHDLRSEIKALTEQNQEMRNRLDPLQNVILRRGDGEKLLVGISELMSENYNLRQKVHDQEKEITEMKSMAFPVGELFNKMEQLLTPQSS